MGLALVGTEFDLTFYARLAARAPGPEPTPVLVLGCGNGRVAFELVERGHRVTAVDPSRAMIAFAEQRCSELGLTSPRTLKLLEADLRSLRLAEQFSVVFAPQNALGLMGSLDELGALLATARHHLRPGGSFAFDLLNPAPLRSPAVERPDEVGPPPTRRIPYLPHLQERKDATRVRSGRSIHRLKLRQFGAAEVDEALRQAGLVALERFGDFEGKAFDADDGLQVVVAAELG